MGEAKRESREKRREVGRGEDGEERVEKRRRKRRRGKAKRREEKVGEARRGRAEKREEGVGEAERQRRRDGRGRKTITEGHEQKAERCGTAKKKHREEIEEG